jgi:sec-independent protein translocase protein TatC
MTPLELTKTATEPNLADSNTEMDALDEFPDEVEMSLFDHLEELRQRIFFSLIALVVGAIGCFIFVKPLVQLLQVPAKGIKFLQLAPGEFFFVSIKVAGYSGLLVATPFILYQIVQFILPGLTKRERGFILPVVAGSSVLFLAGLVFAYSLLIPAAVNFFMNYGEDVVEQLWSIDRYFEFILLLLLSTGLAFQVPVIQVLLGLLGLVSAKTMLSVWRYVLLGAAVLGAILTPSTDPLTQTLLGGAVVGLYFSGVAMVALLTNFQELSQMIKFGNNSTTQTQKEIKQDTSVEAIAKPVLGAIAPLQTNNNPAEDLTNVSASEPIEETVLEAASVEVAENEEMQETPTVEAESQEVEASDRATIPVAENEIVPENPTAELPAETTIDREEIEEEPAPKKLPQRFHSKTIATLFTLLDIWGQGRGVVGTKWSILLQLPGEEKLQTPDLCYISNERLPADWTEDEACTIPPELVIDIVSPKQTFGELIQTATDYLEAGILRVWFVDYTAKNIVVVYADKRPQTFSGDMSLIDPLFEELELIPNLVFQQIGLLG